MLANEQIFLLLIFPRQMLVVRYHDPSDEFFISSAASYLKLERLSHVLPGSGYLFFADAATKQRVMDLNLSSFTSK